MILFISLIIIIIYRLGGGAWGETPGIGVRRATEAGGGEGDITGGGGTKKGLSKRE